MKLKMYLLVSIFFISLVEVEGQEEYTVASFRDVILSPHVEATFVQSDYEAVVIEDSKVNEEKINIVVKGKTLRVYLDHAKFFTKSKREGMNGKKRRAKVYKGTMLRVTIHYKNIEFLSLRGNEKATFQSPIEQEKLKLNIYGHSDISIQRLNLERLKVKCHGELNLNVLDGAITKQRVTVFGDAQINLLGVDNEFTKLISYGDAEFKINARDKIKISSMGDSTLRYSGNPDLRRGINLGDNKIYKIKS